MRGPEDEILNSTVKSVLLQKVFTTVLDMALTVLFPSVCWLFMWPFKTYWQTHKHYFFLYYNKCMHITLAVLVQGEAQGSD